MTGDRLRLERTRAGLSQDAVGLALGMKAPFGHSYVCRLERGNIPKVAFTMVIRYLQACEAPIGKFMLELAQSGAFGETEAENVRGFTAQKQISNEQAKRAKGKLLYEKRWLREAQDADIIAKVWRFRPRFSRCCRQTTRPVVFWRHIWRECGLSIGRGSRRHGEHQTKTRRWISGWHSTG